MRKLLGLVVALVLTIVAVPLFAADYTFSLPDDRTPITLSGSLVDAVGQPISGQICAWTFDATVEMLTNNGQTVFGGDQNIAQSCSLPMQVRVKSNHPEARTVNGTVSSGNFSKSLALTVTTGAPTNLVVTQQ